MTIKEFKIQRALGSMSIDMLRLMAWNHTTPKEILKILAENDDWNVRGNVAYNKNVPKGVLEKLVSDVDRGVRHAAVENLKKRM